ncbi:MAG: fluoride efflux transporter CrcB [Dehalococcoidia bacterium]|nr:fluoride efflux transporter CrcB [Dehalococcoidia bacterium]
MREVLLVGVGGFLGANARYWIAQFAAQRFGVAFPYGTLAINVTGSLVLGVFLAIVETRVPLSYDARLLFAVGFLGAYTTFSTFTVEVLALIERAEFVAAATYVLASVVIGLLAAAVGVWIGRAIA